MPECRCQTARCKLTKTNDAGLNFFCRHSDIPAFMVQCQLSRSMLTSPCCMTKFMLRVQVHAACPSPCFISMTMLYAHVDAACPCQCPVCMSVSVLCIHGHAAYPCPCPCPSSFCMYMSKLHIHVHGLRQCPCCMFMFMSMLYVHMHVHAVYLHACLYVQISIWILYVDVYVYVYVHICIHSHIHVHIHIHIGTCIYIHLLICISTNTVHKCRNAGLSGIRSVRYRNEKITMLEQVWCRTKPSPSGIFLVRYRTKMIDAGMSMLALVCSMQMPRFASHTITSVANLLYFY